MFLHNKYNYPIIVSTHPRTRKMIESREIKLHKNIQLLKPLGFNDYNALQMYSRAVISDSGTISEESSILGFDALNISPINIKKYKHAFTNTFQLKNITFKYSESTSEILNDLKKENYDYVIDLHNNIRTLFLKLKFFCKFAKYI